MAQGIRVQVVLPLAIAEQLRQRAADQSRTVSNLAAFMIEAALCSPALDEPRP
jgi:hypothetical protein